MNSQALDLSKREVTIWKGFAILMVMLNNFYHHLPSVFWIESERRFNVEGTLQFYTMLLHEADIFAPICSCWGHFGVALFLFLSGYGLVQKHENLSVSVGGGVKFMWHNILKMWKLVAVIIALYWGKSFFECLLAGDNVRDALQYMWDSYFLKSVLTFSFTAGFFRMHTFGGAWWFLSLMMQCYVCYWAFHKWKNKALLITVTICSVLLQCALIFVGKDQALIWTRWNCFGWLLPFCMGIWAARYEWIPKSWGVTIVALVCFVISGLNAYTWVIQSLFFIIVCFALPINRDNAFTKGLYVIGILSPYIFVTHSVIRNQILKLLPSFTGCLIFIIVALIVAATYKYCLGILYNHQWKITKEFLGKK